MKKIIVIFFCWASMASAQSPVSFNEYMRGLAEKNFELLSNSYSIKNRVKIKDSGIEIFSHHEYKPEFAIYWDEIPRFVSLIEGMDYYETINFYKNKRSNHFVNAGHTTVKTPYVGFPSDIKGLRVAIDPGHFGGDMEEARLENRLIRIKGADLKVQQDVEFFEADLTYTTALILKEKLEALGAEVMLTRVYGAGSIGKSFSDWLKADFVSDVDQAVKSSEITESNFKQLKMAFQDTVKLANRYYLFQFFKLLDFRERARKINEFYPNVTYVIHYNASEGNRPTGPDRFIVPVKANYSMAFIPGSFEEGELNNPDQKIDFIRLLLSPDLSNSIRLANILVQKHKEILKVEPIPYDSLLKMKDVVITTPYSGVFARNLVLTRTIRGSVVYGESLYQDNYLEAVSLNKKDYTVKDKVSGVVYQTSSRCAQVADAYLKATIQFIEENKEKQREYTARVNH